MASNPLYSIDRAVVAEVFQQWAEELGGQVADFTTKCGPNLLASHFWLTLQDIVADRAAEQMKVEAEADAFVEDCRAFRETHGSGPLKDIIGHRAYRDIPVVERAVIRAEMAAYKTPVKQDDPVDETPFGEPRRKVGHQGSQLRRSSTGRAKGPYVLSADMPEEVEDENGGLG